MELLGLVFIIGIVIAFGSSAVAILLVLLAIFAICRLAAGKWNISRNALSYTLIVGSVLVALSALL